MYTRQPIVSVLGHVDHGKTTILDVIRGGTVAEREAGRITQHIGATEVPMETIIQKCGTLIKDPSKFKVPGLLFIDTPGHKAFTSLRSRGGALADLAILVVDVREGFQPQTFESVRILKRTKTPFVVAANKVDRLPGWIPTPDSCFAETLARQSSYSTEALDKAIYEIVGVMNKEGFSSERYDRIENFTRNIAIVPISAKENEGIGDLLLVLVGLAQRFLEEQLQNEEVPGAATVLEVKEIKGLGPTFDIIIYSGMLQKTDRVVVGSANGPLETKIKALMKPKPLDEIRDPRERFDNVDKVVAAAGLKVCLHEHEGVFSGAPLRVITDENREAVIEEITKEIRTAIEFNEEGILVKADAMGSIEALVYELKEAKVPIKRGIVGDISKREVVDVSTLNEPLHRAILGFNVKLNPDAKDVIENPSPGACTNQVKVITGDIIYRLVEEYQAWALKRKGELESASRDDLIYPGMMRILSDHIFRISKPAIVGVRVLGGRIKVDQRLINLRDGQEVGRIKSIRSGEESLPGAKQGDEVAIAIPGPTVGRHIKEDDILIIDIPEGDFKKLSDMACDLTMDEREVMEKLAVIKRKERAFWGR